MASFFDLPLEIIMMIICALKRVGAISQTCHSLRALCLPKLFRHIGLTNRPSELLRRKSFGLLMDKIPEIADYVQKLKCEIYLPQDLDHDDISRILMRFRRVQNFQLLGENGDWNTLPQAWRESLSYIIHLPTIKSLKFSSFNSFPVALFSPCLNLTNLTIVNIYNDSMADTEQMSLTVMAPQIRSFTCGEEAAGYAQRLVAARRSTGLPLLDFKNLSALSVHMDQEETQLVHALLKTTEKLEVLEYIVDDGEFWTDLLEYEGLAASINTCSLSTLRCLTFSYEIDQDVQDPLYGLCPEFETLSGINRIEEIKLDILVQTDCSCTTDYRWGALDTVLAKGFPMLRRVLIHITISVSRYTGIELQEELEKLPEEQLLRLSKSSVVRLDFSTKIEKLPKG